MNPPSKKLKPHKFLGILSIFFGVSSLIIIFSADSKQLFFANAENIFTKYILVIFGINAALYFTVMGIIYFHGIILIYPSVGYSKIDSKKSELLTIILMSPFVLSLSVLIFNYISFIGKFFWAILLLFLVWIVISDYKLIRATKGARHKGNEGDTL